MAAASGEEGTGTNNETPKKSIFSGHDTSDPDSSDHDAPLPRRRLGQRRVAENPLFNKPRVTLPIAAQPKTQKFTPWAAEQNRQDCLQRDSWFRDQSVIEPGQKPEAPIFGPSRELALNLGSSIPILYSQRLTPTDITQILDENRDLRNRALERMINCTMCDEKFTAWDKGKIQKHWNLHKEQITSAGKCPICSSDHWIFWSVEQRKEHLEDHRNDADEKLANDFWNGLQCPVCDRNLSSMQHEDVLLHMAEHPSGVLQFCDRCGLHISDCNEIETAHHRRVCTEGGDRKKTDPELKFCNNCGMDLTKPTSDQEEEHRKNCWHTRGIHCTICGLKMNSWVRAEEDRHRSHCKPPRGFMKKHCRKCAFDLSNCDPHGLSFHAQTCYINDPRQTTEGERIKELKKWQEIAGQMDARIIGSLAYIRTRTEHQNHKELELNEREAALNEREHGDQPEELGQCPFEGCAKVLGTMSKLSLATHFATHSGAGVTFKCPLDGCDHWRPLPLNMANGGQQLKEHYKHNDEDVQGEQSAQNSVLTTKSAKKRNGGKVLFVAQQTEHGNTHPAASNPSELPAEDSKSKSNEVDGSSLQISTQQTPSLKQSSIAKPSPIRRMQTPSKVVPMSPNAKDSATSGLVDSTLL